VALFACHDLSIDDDNWKVFQKELEGFVKLVRPRRMDASFSPSHTRRGGKLTAGFEARHEWVGTKKDKAIYTFFYNNWGKTLKKGRLKIPIPQSLQPAEGRRESLVTLKLDLHRDVPIDAEELAACMNASPFLAKIADQVQQGISNGERFVNAHCEMEDLDEQCAGLLKAVDSLLPVILPTDVTLFRGSPLEWDLSEDRWSKTSWRANWFARWDSDDDSLTYEGCLRVDPDEILTSIHEWKCTLSGLIRELGTLTEPLPLPGTEEATFTTEQMDSLTEDKTANPASPRPAEPTSYANRNASVVHRRMKSLARVFARELKAHLETVRNTQGIYGYALILGEDPNLAFPLYPVTNRLEHQGTEDEFIPEEWTWEEDEDPFNKTTKTFGSIWNKFRKKSDDEEESILDFLADVYHTYLHVMEEAVKKGEFGDIAYRVIWIQDGYEPGGWLINQSLTRLNSGDVAEKAKEKIEAVFSALEA